MSKPIENDFTKKIREILEYSFLDYTEEYIDKVADQIFVLTGRVDYRAKYVKKCEEDNKNS